MNTKAPNMAEIRNLGWIRHLRAETTSHVLAYHKGALRQRGRGLAFWFWPMHAAIAEVPIDDRDQAFLFGARTKDYQHVAVQGVITYRMTSAELVAERIDFSIDLRTGAHRKQPLEQLAALLTGLAQQAALQHIAQSPVQQLLTDGFGVIQRKIEGALAEDPSLTELGIEVVDVRIHDLTPAPELEKALQTPTREALQQTADEATFQRRALAVEKERAIAENELNNQVQLAKQQEQLLAQQGQNERLRTREEVEAKQMQAVAAAERKRIEAAAEASRIEIVEHAKVNAERARIDAYRDLPTSIMFGLAAEEVAKHLQVEQLNVTPDLLAAVLGRLSDAHARPLPEATR